jgi:phospholipase/carboxylesterase
MTGSDPHASSTVFAAKRNPKECAAAAIFIHGRGGSAAQFLSVAEEILPATVAAFAPQAHGSTWYPESFLATGSVNEAGRESAHRLIERVIDELGKRRVPRERIVLVGFSQGACVVADHLHLFPGRYGAAVCFIGGLIGPLGTNFAPRGSLQGTPVLLASTDPDPHVPWSRVEETGRILSLMHASVSIHRSEGAPHAITHEWIVAARKLLAANIG